MRDNKKYIELVKLRTEQAAAGCVDCRKTGNIYTLGLVADGMICRDCYGKRVRDGRSVRP